MRYCPQMCGWDGKRIRALVAAFEGLTLRREEWDHEAHLVVAAVLVARHGPRAVEAIRKGINRLNAHFGVEQTPHSGYHETLTVLYTRLISAHLTSLPKQASEFEQVSSVVLAFADKRLPLRYYSSGLLGSPQARVEWVAPDLAPLP